MYSIAQPTILSTNKLNHSIAHLFKGTIHSDTVLSLLLTQHAYILFPFCNRATSILVEVMVALRPSQTRLRIYTLHVTVRFILTLSLCFSIPHTLTLIKLASHGARKKIRYMFTLPPTQKQGEIEYIIELVTTTLCPFSLDSMT